MTLQMEDIETIDGSDLLELIRAKANSAGFEPVEVIERRCFVDPGPLVPEGVVLAKGGLAIGHSDHAKRTSAE
jgi:hypothetical protein